MFVGIVTSIGPVLSSDTPNLSRNHSLRSCLCSLKGFMVMIVPSAPGFASLADFISAWPMLWFTLSPISSLTINPVNPLRFRMSIASSTSSPEFFASATISL